ncbi:M28 family peptidase, partial [Candidatus Poribacteria bacterium]|nr:M28 family peptidase [Candidatus Poribacteria bacterium]
MFNSLWKGIELIIKHSAITKVKILFSVIVFSFLVISSAYPDSQAKPVFNADIAFKYLQKQCQFGPRYPGSDAHKKTRDYLLAEMKKYTKDTTAQDFVYQSKNGPLKLTNIIGVFSPNKKESNSGKKEKVLLAAHWDTRPFADKESDPEKSKLPILGANDGASGVAILLEICRVLSLNPPNKTVIVVLFDGEDYGSSNDEMLLGSKYFASNMDPRWKPDYGILIDMVGDKDLDIYIELNSMRAAPDIVKKVWKIAEKLELKGIYKDFGLAIFDDHIPLIEAGIKCIN